MQRLSLWALPLLLFLAVDVTIQDQVFLDCQPGWTLMGVQCYKLYQDIVLPWESAAHVCQRYGAELAKVTDFAENQEVGQFATQQSIQTFWIDGRIKMDGFTRNNAPLGNRVIAYFSDGEETSTARGFWENDQPNDDNGKCVYIMQKMDRYYWTFGPCEKKLPYVCQRPACPQGSFHCVNGRCINENLKCDGEDDCGDSSDENNCAIHCTSTIERTAGSITSLNYPTNYPDSRNCLWVIKVPLGQNAYLRFTNLTTELGDMIEVLVGGMTEERSQLVATISGDRTSNLPDFVSHNNLIIVKFSSDSSRNSIGFRAEYSGRSANLAPLQYLTASDSTSTLFSPGYPQAYLGSQDYTWVIRSQRPTKIITLNIKDMDLKGDDEVLVRDGDSVDANLLYRFKSSTKASDVPYIFSTGPSIYISMQTRGYHVGKGFDISYVQGCAMVLTTPTGHIFSPGYQLSSDLKASNYPNLVNCVYKVNVPSMPILTINYLDFKTMPEDKVTVLYGTGLVDELSGSSTGVTYRRSTSGRFNIVFATNAIQTTTGFSFKYSMDCPDPNFNDKTILTPPSNPPYQYGSFFTVTCDEGYHFASEEFQDRTINSSFVSINTASMKCELGGKWNYRTTPNCQPKYCDLAPSVPNAYVSSSLKQANSFAGSVIYSCYPGFTMTGGPVVGCRNDGTWAPTPTCSIASCPNPNLAIPDGSGMITNGDGTEYSTTITYSCKPGYQILGEKILFCTSSSTWTAPVPTCVRKFCPEPSIMHGRLDNPSLAKFEESRSLVCDSGYKMTGGTNPFLCGADEKFINLDAMSCEDIDECAIDGTCSQGCTDSDGSYKCHCNPGYELQSDGRTCLDIKECSTPNKGGCSQICNEREGSYSCSCRAGFQLFTSNGQLNYTIPSTETGNGENDIYRFNYTCIRIQCPDPPTLMHGYLLTRRRYHRFEDQIIMNCDIGYSLANPADGVRECLSNGEWSRNNPVCVAATCSPDSVPPGLLTVPSVSPSVAVNYLDYVNLTCNVPGKPEFVKQRKCLLNPVTKEYQLYGANFECGVIDCGTPHNVPGAVIPTGISTRFGTSFAFTCKNLYTKEGTSSLGTDEVTCKANGYWGWNTLRCVGLTCTDPGRPIDATQHATTYEEGKEVNYTCNYPGFTLTDPTPLKCVINDAGNGLKWSRSLPECIDTTEPVFLNCVPETTVVRYTAASVAIPSIPVATDNNAIKSYKILPAYPSSSYLISEQTTFQFIVEDYNGNQKTCTTRVKIQDQVPPFLRCPDYLDFELEEVSDHRYQEFQRSFVQVSDNSGVNPAVVFSPPSVNMSGAMIGQANYKQWVYVSATDEAGNTNSCRFQVMVKAPTCSPLSLPTPVHGQKECTKTANGYSCTLRCDQSYAFYDQAPQTEIVTSCGTGGTFNLLSKVPACSYTLNDSPEYTQRISFTYSSVNQAPLDNCESDIIKAVSELTGNLGTLIGYCSNIKPLPRVTISQILPSDVTINTQTKRVTVVYTFVFRDSATNKLESCATLIATVLKDINFDETRTLAGESSIIKPESCPQIRDDGGAGTVVFEDFRCTDDRKLVEIPGSGRHCLSCPRGTYKVGNSCVVCPVGTFSNTEGATVCQGCPENTWTYTTGASSMGMCKAMCELGTFSESRLPPCKPCPLNTYGVNSTNCQNCPTSSITREVASISATACKSQCGAGTYNAADGHENCNLCPKNYYQDMVGQLACTECEASKITAFVGSNKSADCIADGGSCNGYCNQGTCSFVRHGPTCDCADGYSGQNCQIVRNACASSPCKNGGTCSPSGLSYTCNCPQGTSGTDCEIDLNNCPSNNPCDNDGMCQDQLDNIRCLCKEGFAGDTCRSIQSICDVQPCIFGTCTPIDNIRRECTCVAGYTGKDCDVNIKECDENPCQHGGTCEDRVNGFQCSCRSGYSGSRCEVRLNLCSGVLCGGRGRCIEDPIHDTYRCVCDPDAGYGEHCEYSPILNMKLTDETFQHNDTGVTLASCKQSCDSDGASCIAFSYYKDSQTCLRHDTRSGALPLLPQVGASYYDKQCSEQKDDFFTQWFATADPVLNSNILSFTYLKDTLQLDICGGTEPLDIECRDSVTKETTTNIGTSCSVNQGFRCTDDVQPGSATCNQHEVRFKCAASRVFKENTCNPFSYCASSPCVHGTCQTVGLTFECQCDPGFSGSLCQNNVDECAGGLCANGATCEDKVNDIQCHCDRGWEGKYCTQRIDFCNPYPCNATGTANCTSTLTGPACFCRDGFTGPGCSQEIDECLSNPCYHDGECVDRVGTFECRCKSGWLGPRCELLQKPCESTSPCQNEAECINLFGDYHCSCKANTYGDRCESTANICSNANPCVHGNCSESGGVPKCICGQDYYGTGCEIKRDHCGDMSHICANKGMCHVPALDKYTCTCPPGFTGDNCQNNINDCIGNTCPAQAQCIDGVNQHFCRCPAGYTGPNCAQVVDRNYDMLFELPQKTSHAYLPYPIRLSASQFTISMWVRYWSSDGEGTFFTLYSVRDGNSLTDKYELLRLDHEGLYVNIGGDRRFVQPRNVNYNDGKWYMVTVSWRSDSGHLRFDINTISNTIMGYAQGTTIDSHVWMVLGARYNPMTEMPVKDEGFNGWLSQLSIYDRVLVYTNEIPLKYEQPLLTFENEIFAWNEFRRSQGVSVIIPSTASASSCPRGYSGSSCVPDPRKMVVYPSHCPSDQVVFGPSRITKMMWTSPLFEGAPSSVISTYKSNDVFIWGRYLVVYVATNSAGNKGLCSFKLFVQYTECPLPANPLNGRQQESRSQAPWITNKIQCNSGYETVRPVPSLYTCPRIGTYNPAKPYNRFKFPACGSVVNNERRMVFAQIFYRITSIYCSGIRTGLAKEVLYSIQLLNTAWPGLCKESSCADTVIVVNCDEGTRRKRQTATVKDVVIDVTLPSSLKLLTNGQQTLSPEDVLRLAILSDSKFNFSSNYPTAVPLNDLLIVNGTLSCPEGQTIVSDNCVKCAPGTFFNTMNKTCDDCPIGEYQPGEGQTSCNSCNGKITELAGATSLTDCKDNCPIGHKFDYGKNLCVPCPIGFYQNRTGQFYCDPCSVEKTTGGEGSTTINACYVGCQMGKQLGVSGNCENCPIGKYRNASMQRCADCPNGLTTQNDGADDESLCNVGDCQAGFYRNATNERQCVICPLGTYQPDKNQGSCIPCGTTQFHTTTRVGATSQNECRFSCGDGTEQNPTNPDLCKGCDVGYFRNATLTPYALKCWECTEGTSTRTTFSINPNDCTVLKCPIGEQPKGDNSACEPCPQGTYQDTANQQLCKPCTSGTSTRLPGAKSDGQCETFCPPGQEKLSDRSCKACDVGDYKENTVNPFMECTRCPNMDYVTASTGTDSAGKCTVRNCQPGTKRKGDDSGCDLCPFGEYQPLSYQPSCIPCTGLKWTRQQGSNDSSQCEEHCPDGQEKNDGNGQCDVCPRGYYKTNVPDKFSKCQMCQPDKITAATGATSSSDCTIANCSAGFRTNGNTCQRCPVGTYQPLKWQPSCITCETDKTTVSDASTMKSDCILSCPPGKEDTGGACTVCKVGYYKREQKAAPCTECTTNKTTEAEGSTSSTDCNIVGCPAGYFNVSRFDCEACGYGEYQPLRWQTSCRTCGSGNTTFIRGATDSNDCVLDCPKGQQYNAGTKACDPCPQGYYQDKTNPSFPMCKVCGDQERITAGTGSMSAADCTVRNCTTPGEFINKTMNECQACPVGTYQDMKWQESCKPCLNGFTTRLPGSPSSASCVRSCQPGSTQVGDQCVDCGIGKYRDGSTWECLECPDDLSTTSLNAASLDDCNVSPCLAGSYFDRTLRRCEVCETNTYQTENAKFACEDCPDRKFTLSTGSSSADDCKGFCDISNNCSPNALCIEDVDTNYRCECMSDYVGNGLNCTHKCDTDYCQSGSTCTRGPPAFCQCTEFYKGDTCAIRRAAEQVSDQNTITIVGIVVGILGFLLLLILIAACLYRRRSVPDKVSEYDDRTSIARGPYDYPLAYVPSVKAASVVSGPRYAMGATAEKSYDNQLFFPSEGDPAVYQA